MSRTLTVHSWGAEGSPRVVCLHGVTSHGRHFTQLGERLAPRFHVQALNLRYAWPSGDWGSLPLEGGIEAAYRRELEAAPDRDALLREIEARLNAVRSPFRTAEAFGVEEIIDPRDTRPVLCEFADIASKLLRPEPARVQYRP